MLRRQKHALIGNLLLTQLLPRLIKTTLLYLHYTVGHQRVIIDVPYLLRK